MSTFFSYAEKALRAGGTSVQGGRLQASVSVGIAELANPAATQTIPTDYELFGPGDVLRLGASTVSRRYPSPGTSDAEQPKLALVEFEADDLPWRYTPQVAAGTTLRPWLVLLVGQAVADQLVVRPDGRVGVGLTTQATHTLINSDRWAHVHTVGARTVSRLLSPFQLDPDTDYVACLVPAFAADGTPAWDGTSAAVVDCYDRWGFRTGPQGDFLSLAEQLHKADLSADDAGGVGAGGGAGAGAVGTVGAHPFGRADVAYVRRSDGSRLVLPTAGALRLPPSPQPDPIDAPPDPSVTAEVNHLSDRIVTPDGRGVVTAPRYDAPFVDRSTQDAVPPGGWVDGLRGDPRARGAAGLGAWNTIAWQDRIADAAAVRAGDLAVADDRIRHVALGVEASRSIWRRRVPPLPADGDATAAAELLDVLGPALARLPAGGQSVLDVISGRTPQLTGALFSSAARRVLRPGPARTARAADGAAALAGVLVSANRCPVPAPDPADVVDSHNVRTERMQEAAKAALSALAPDDPDLVEQVLDFLFVNGRRPSVGELAAAGQALAPGKDGHADPAAVRRFQSGDFPPGNDPGISSWGPVLDNQAPAEPCDPVDLVGLARAVAGAIDPTVALPPAARRVLATLPALSGIGPVEIEPELDLPLWSFLSRSAPDWMLPGAGELQLGDVVALATNPPFVQALLAGANEQATGELRWRNIAMTSRWSPLRKFWQRPPGEYDINPIKDWPATAPLGDPSLTPPPGRGSEAVVAFRTTLFRRYPATVVYLYPAAPGWVPPGPDQALAAPDRIDHSFTGTIGDDITFFGFPIDPSELSTHWVVLEEPPAGYRFFHEPQLPEPGPVSAAHWADNRFAVPVRVLIGPLL